MLKISVVLCTYNGEKYFKRSIINQTYPIYEIFYAFFAYRDCGVSV